MRFRIILSYLGTNFSGWQKQPADPSVQQSLEESLSTLLREPIEVVGCGRTDTGVHARNYVAHFDATNESLPGNLLYQLNSILPFDIAVHTIEPTHENFHARFDAKQRTYRYYLHFEKDPFLQNQSFFFPFKKELNYEWLDAAAQLLKEYEQFKPFCKTGSDAEHYIVYLKESTWEVHPDRMVFTISANRFLRGMVRLIVGATLNVGLGKISLLQLKQCMDTQMPVPKAWSVPPEGLFLESIKYVDE
jgi:tRNA pseudouridine38-40 synthase